MKHDEDTLERRSGIPAHPERAANAVGIATGAAVGAGTALFAFAGPVAVVIGAGLGAVAAALVVGFVRRRSIRVRADEARLDRELGVIGGDIGAPPPVSAP